MTWRFISLRISSYNGIIQGMSYSGRWNENHGQGSRNSYRLGTSNTCDRGNRSVSLEFPIVPRKHTHTKLLFHHSSGFVTPPTQFGALPIGLKKRDTRLRKKKWTGRTVSPSLHRIQLLRVDDRVMKEIPSLVHLHMVLCSVIMLLMTIWMHGRHCHWKSFVTVPRM
jgi:hypothetical protein